MMDMRKIQDKVLGDMEDEMGARRAGLRKKPLLTIDIIAGGPEEDEEDEMEGEEEVPMPSGNAGWEEYLKKRYGK